MIKVSHETPLCLLEDSKYFNDYDYALVHLLDEDPEYAAYFINAREKGRYILFQNILKKTIFIWSFLVCLFYLII